MPPPPTRRASLARRLERAAAGAALAVLIMCLGSLVLWLGTPLLWLWAGSQVQGATGSVGAAFALGLVGAILTVSGLATLLLWLSDAYRANHRARDLPDPGHAMLERVVVWSAALSVTVFVVWFLFFAGASPIPIGIQV